MCGDVAKPLCLIPRSQNDREAVLGRSLEHVHQLGGRTSFSALLEFVGESYRFRQRMLMEGQATATETG